MTLALAIVLMFIGCTLIWVAAHGTDATTPWEIYRQVVEEWQDAT